MTYMSSAAAISSLTPLGSCSSPAADSPAAIRSRNAIRREYFSAARWLRAALALRFAELDSADLASQRLRELVHELDLPRVGVGREMAADEPLDLITELVRGLGALGEDDERLDQVAAALIGGGHGGGLAHRRVLDARRLHLEGADPVAGRDDHVVGAAGVPVVTVLILLGGILAVEPLALEILSGRLRVLPVGERIVRIRPAAQADLAPLPCADRVFVLIEDLDVPAGHRLAHRPLADLHEGEVPAERI